ncbi:MAG: hypothetical protein J7623_07465 [Chitinophaga sp.]|uniref:hypothetical protein n=1 Tax=Chitinophaga sp. TaxID=1869181 RepID=UPI001B2869CF|nr:hypothetical protein [Chitinophaga sp.]MBO9728463.1 hypothetical protein [Chitinophaga sp.]
MIDEIVKRYGDFSDALIWRFSFESNVHSASGKGSIEVLINCMNHEGNFEWERIILVFEEVLCFRFAENRRTSSVVVNAVMIKQEHDEIVFDFFPLILADGIAENPQSDLIIRCKRVKYTSV